MKILILNAGSSSQKSCLYDITSPIPNVAPQPLWEGKINWTQDQNFVTQVSGTNNTRIATTAFVDTMNFTMKFNKHIQTMQRKKNSLNFWEEEGQKKECLKAIWFMVN